MTNLIEVYNCDVNFDFLKDIQSKLIDGVIKFGDNKPIVDKSVKSSKEYGFKPDDPRLISYRNHLQECLEKYIKKYHHIVHHPHFNVIENINYQVYEPGDGYYNWHFEDIDIGRVLVFTTYLTDTKDAGTEFCYQNYKSECKKGTTLLWPAYWTHTHRGMISKTERKEILTGWFTTTGKVSN